MNAALQKKILSMCGQKSFGLIAEHLGISRSTVAGICFRADNSGKNRNGLGRGGSREYAPKTKRIGPPFGNRNGVRRSGADASARMEERQAQ